MTITIRDIGDFRPEDLFALFGDVYSSSEGMSETLADKFPDLASFRDDLAALCSLPGKVALAAEIDGKPVAYLSIRPRRQSRLRHTADLSMGVARAARGQGLGEALLQAGLAQASASPELEIVYLMVRSDNVPAIRLYERAGFETLAVLARDTKIEDSYFDGLLMRKFVTAGLP